ncbi:hypothetical protein P154DRAFT_563502 [Amniculicola lignicola CBS 123094]|uniref:Uncharacterized protein n=1 Tax=Amniculicola lignicola CBS 123094 TaxID=1392246 RepID=A0A6A5WH05_9PLEO|nr:hypothetical protein P154DRAFT_563502 [Amniculicola lignicola CBS 123094]
MASLAFVSALVCTSTTLLVALIFFIFAFLTVEGENLAKRPFLLFVQAIHIVFCSLALGFCASDFKDNTHPVQPRTEIALQLAFLSFSLPFLTTFVPYHSIAWFFFVCLFTISISITAHTFQNPTNDYTFSFVPPILVYGTSWLFAPSARLRSWVILLFSLLAIAVFVLSSLQSSIPFLQTQKVAYFALAVLTMLQEGFIFSACQAAFLSVINRFTSDSKFLHRKQQDTVLPRAWFGGKTRGDNKSLNTVAKGEHHFANWDFPKTSPHGNPLVLSPMPRKPSDTTKYDFSCKGSVAGPNSQERLVSTTSIKSGTIGHKV